MPPKFWAEVVVFNHQHSIIYRQRLCNGDSLEAVKHVAANPGELASLALAHYFLDEPDPIKALHAQMKELEEGIRLYTDKLKKQG